MVLYRSSGWSDSLIALLGNYGPLMAILFFLPLVYLMSSLSLRWSVVLSGLLMASSTLLRLPVPGHRLPDHVFTVLCHVSAVLNGIAGVVLCSAPAAVSAAWFPPDERVTATSIGQSGTAVA